VNRRGPLVAALVGVGLVIVTVAGLILPKAAAVRSKQEQVVQAQKQETTLAVQLQQLQADAKHAGVDNRRLAQLGSQIPPTADLPGLIRLLNSAADQSGVDFMTLSPGQPTLAPDGKLSIIPAQILVSGQYFAVDQFLYRLETLPRVSRVGSVTVSAASGTGGVTALQVSVATTFYTTDTSAGPGSVPGPTQGTSIVPSTSTTSTSSGA